MGQGVLEAEERGWSSPEGWPSEWARKCDSQVARGPGRSHEIELCEDCECWLYDFLEPRSAEWYSPEVDCRVC